MRPIGLGRAKPTHIADRGIADQPYKCDWGYYPSGDDLGLVLVTSSCSYTGHSRMLAFSDFFDHLGVERGNVIRLAAGHQAVIDDDLFVHPIAPSILDVALNRGPRRESPPTHQAGFNQHPWSVADGADR